MNEWVLIVDDDTEILNSFRRHLYRRYHLETAGNGPEGLRKLKEHAYAVVISDYMMPQMNGIHFLSLAREAAPNTVRIMLTGNANLSNAMESVNEGQVFRFLTKPCTPEALARVIQAGIDYNQLLNAERVLLEQTLNGSISLMVEILGLINPTAFSRAMRIKKLVSIMIQVLKITPAWFYELAAVLSQIGFVSVPPYILDKIYAKEALDEQESVIFNDHPHTARKLIEKIPRLESIAQMIDNQNVPYDEYIKAPSLHIMSEPAVIGAQLLKIAIDYDTFSSSGHTNPEILQMMGDRGWKYNPHLLSALRIGGLLKPAGESINIEVKNLQTGMVVAEDIFTTDSLLLLQAGMEITEASLMRLVNIHANSKLRLPIFVLPLINP